MHLHLDNRYEQFLACKCRSPPGTVAGGHQARPQEGTHLLNRMPRARNRRPQPRATFVAEETELLANVPTGSPGTRRAAG